MDAVSVMKMKGLNTRLSEWKTGFTYNPANGKLHELNELAYVILSLIPDNRLVTPNEICEYFTASNSNEFGISLVTEILEQLIESQLLTINK